MYTFRPFKNFLALYTVASVFLQEYSGLYNNFTSYLSIRYSNFSFKIAYCNGNVVDPHFMELFDLTLDHALSKDL